MLQSHRTAAARAEQIKEKAGTQTEQENLNLPLDNRAAFVIKYRTELGGRAVRKKQQPDKRQTEMSVSYPAFLF